jgi:enoyl-[acyl-carrier protein] reductase II
VQSTSVDIIVAKGFRAGGHNGRDETTIFTLIPMVKDHRELSIIAACGIANVGLLLAAIVLGLDAVPVG